MLSVTYDPILVIASILVAIMASYTGLRLASNLGKLTPRVRKREIAKAAVALGGGIWSMHFVAMLAVQIPVAIQYDALPTLGSVLVAILVTGLGLMVLHFGERSRMRIVLAGVLTGLGIVAMHYIGMSAIGGNCIVSYQPVGYVVSTAIAIGASTAALWLAYNRRTLTQIALGSVILGCTIAMMHYSAMIYTRFALATEIRLIQEPNLSTGALALVVAVAAFLICGLFLLTALPLERKEAVSETADAAPMPAAEPEPVHEAETVSEEPHPACSRLPYEVDHATRFISADRISAIRADGHYTRLRNGKGEVFCPWPISRVETELDHDIFIRTHRSYLVNLRHVQGFERDGDKAFCLVGEGEDQRVPVSRARVREVRRALSLD